MIHMRKRWPILTVLGITLTYGANHYQIAGIENLRIEPRAHRAAQGITPDASAFGFSELGTQLNSDGITSPRNSGSTFDNIPPWKDMLSVAEKFAMWEDQTAAAPSPSSSSFSFPGSVPIPFPNDLPTNGLQALAPNALQDAFPKTLASNLPPTVVGADSFPALLPVEPARNVPANNLIQKSVSRTTDLFTTVPTSVSSSSTSSLSPENRLRIASFNLGGFGPSKLAKPHVLELLVGILRQYDVVALQQVQSTRDDILPLIVERLNQSGRSYDYLVGPRVGRADQREQFAFVFDTSRLETDRFQLYTVDDPEEIMTYDPLVAWFRCKGVASDHAFTFSLVNVHIDPGMAHAEQALLPNLIEAIEGDGREEDDWILLGDFAGGSSTLTMLHNSAIRFALQDIPTDVAGECMLDAILFSARGTTEFTGRSGAFDFLRKYNLSLESALEVSSHMPIWAEFSTIEGAEPGRIAPVDADRVF
jgi:deoxyribonuclease-1-like protein